MRHFDTKRKHKLCASCMFPIHSVQPIDMCNMCKREKHFACVECRCVKQRFSDYTRELKCNMNDYISKLNLRLTTPYLDASYYPFIIPDLDDNHDGFFYYETRNIKKGDNILLRFPMCIDYVKILYISHHNVTFFDEGQLRVVPGLGLVINKWHLKPLMFHSDVDFEIKMILYKIKGFSKTVSIYDSIIAYTHELPYTQIQCAIFHHYVFNSKK